MQVAHHVSHFLRSAIDRVEITFVARERDEEMGSLSITSACHRASIKDGHKGLRRSLDAMWAHLRSVVPDMEAQPKEGIHQFQRKNKRFRYLSAPGLWALEFDDLSEGEAWECFALMLEDGQVRTGWHRRGSKPGEEPLPWLAACCEMHLEGTVEPKVWPDFVSLSVAYASTTVPAISSDDVEERQALLAEVHYLRDQSAEQSRKIRELKLTAQAMREHASADKDGEQDVQQAASRDWTLSDLAEWAEENADRILVMPRAISECKKSDYGNHELFYQCMELLAETYRLVKLGQIPREQLKEQADSLGLEIGGSVEPSRAGSCGEEYFVRYDGRRRFLEQHLASGTSRQTRFCLRIYFFWDDELERVVVGSAPGHLSNRFS